MEKKVIKFDPKMFEKKKFKLKFPKQGPIKPTVSLSEWQKRVLFFAYKNHTVLIREISVIFGSDYGFGSYGKGRVTAKWWERYLGKLVDIGMLKLTQINYGGNYVSVSYSITKEGKKEVMKYQDSIAEYIASAL